MSASVSVEINVDDQDDSSFLRSAISIRVFVMIWLFLLTTGCCGRCSCESNACYMRPFVHTRLHTQFEVSVLVVVVHSYECKLGNTHIRRLCSMMLYHSLLRSRTVKSEFYQVLDSRCCLEEFEFVRRPTSLWARRVSCARLSPWRTNTVLMSQRNFPTGTRGGEP